MVDSIESGGSQALNLQLAVASVRKDQEQVAATAASRQDTQKDTEAQNQVQPPQVNTGLSGARPGDTDTAPGANLDITA